ncbi:MAG: hypothetical protein JXM75_12510 [Chromatiaceae bacterium]|nr:hypothetical protein [Chromatiaceae bacterium]
MALAFLAKVQTEPQPAANMQLMIFRNVGSDQGRIEAGRYVWRELVHGQDLRDNMFI